MSGKLKAILLLGVMFGLGLASGVIWKTCQSHGEFRRHWFLGESRIGKLKRQLNLSPDQEQAVRAIFQQARERANQVNEEVSWDLAEIHHDSVQAIQRILSPDQARRFEQLHRQYHARQNRWTDEMETSTAPVKGKS